MKHNVDIFWLIDDDENNKNNNKNNNNNSTNNTEIQLKILIRQ